MINVIISWLISFFIGHCCLRILFPKKDTLHPFLNIGLSAGLGLGLSSYLTFTSFLFFNSFQFLYLIIIHLFCAGIACFYSIKKLKKNSSSFWSIPKFQWIDSIALLIIVAGCIPLIYQASFYRFGGWDAWSVWNIKAHFLFLGGEHWRDLFDPALWRSSPHYPLFLPLLNAWGWCFLEKPNYFGPMSLAIIFVLSTALTLYGSLSQLTKSKLSILPLSIMLSCPLFIKLTIGQYSDIIVGLYSLAAVASFLFYTKTKNTHHLILTGIFLGFMTFAKAEGLLAAFMLTFFIGIYLLLKNKFTLKLPTITLGLSTFLCTLPAIIFKIFYAPKNITMINGLFSETHPINWLRFQQVLHACFIDVIAPHWNGLWILIIGLILLRIKKLIQLPLSIIPLFLIAYSGMILFYYLLNTYFEDIYWWVGVTLDRILFSLLPLILFWIFLLFKEITAEKN